MTPGFYPAIRHSGEVVIPPFEAQSIGDKLILSNGLSKNLSGKSGVVTKPPGNYHKELLTLK